MKTIDAAAEARAAELVAMLSDPGAYQKWLAEMRGIIAVADSKLAEASAAEIKTANADKLFRDATAMLAKQTAREEALADKEANLREREEQLAAKVAAADEQHGHAEVGLTARARLLDQRTEVTEAARKLLHTGLERVRSEWVALKKVGEDVDALRTIH
jgi:Skp family chaperone for outer membrane proteins